MGLLDRFKKADKDSAKAVSPAVAKPAAKSETKPVTKTGTTAKPQAKAVTPVQITVQNVNILVRPIVTEKSTATGTYYFQVTKSASKNEVAKAFQARFGKAPRKVNIVNVLGKTKFRGRTAGKRADWKKAVIYLNKGETVDTSK